ncbi:efflux RND transporter permease subunit [Singulisphaera sp. GP187]|uniref:efflux RND transporter permease subunit n=1 Tax=Singulisphaera sp. GP187 TaxID=1882752 RepID=UPI000941A2C4|nr:efflux RND transporter permease subunit [Singulisphaera sp. GP187]
MWIVKLALRRPYTFVVMALLIVVMSVVAVRRMPVDIFPEIDIPVITVIWQYPGTAPSEMESRIVTVSERALTTTVNDIEHIESQSLTGVGLIKVFFHPGAKIEAAVAQVNAISGTILKSMPPGITPPLIIRYSASNVPILQLGLSSPELSEQQLFDLGQNFLRTQLATVQGAQVPPPLGGRPRQIMVDLDLKALHANGLSPTDISDAINAQNLILPSGTAKMGDRDYLVRLNSSPDAIALFNDFPIKKVGDATLRIQDVANVRDGYAVQSNVVVKDGRRGSLLTVLKAGGASTLDIVTRIREALPQVLSGLPDSLEVDFLFDQSVFVRAAIEGVVKEAALAAGLTALMILLFLGSWRSTLVVVLSIPLSICVAILVLAALGHSINTMTLGGMALAVGILVDDATVEIENIHRNLHFGKPLRQAILDGAEQIATPAFVATLAICIVFLPVFFLSGAARSLFSPMATAVVSAMMASYFLSRTLVPTMVNYLLAAEVDRYRDPQGGEAPDEGLFWVVHRAFNRVFERLLAVYASGLAWALGHRPLITAGFAAASLGTLGLVGQLGQDFFPRVDAGQIRLHVRAPAGTRIERTEEYFQEVEREVREIIPAGELETVLSNIGLPPNGINLTFGDSSTVGTADGEMLVSLKEGHQPTEGYVRRIRARLARNHPELTVFFQPADIVSQILNFGLAAPIDVQIIGRDQVANLKVARQVESVLRLIPGAVDVHLHQVADAPELRIDVDRTRARHFGLSQRDVASSLLVSLSSSGQVAPNFWLNPKNGVSYPVAVQTPQHLVDSIENLDNTPVVGPGGGRRPQLLANLANVSRSEGMAVVNHFNVQPVFDVFANVEGRDLGGVAGDLERALEPIRAKLPKGTKVVVRGQVESMATSFRGLASGLVFAILLVYLLMVVNFQSWLDPFIILFALPGALSGIILMLYATHTTLSVPSLMGSIMCIGVATANSILMVTFANDRRAEGDTALEAALAAGRTRLRPVLMTAAAMIIGMVPMALGVGEGGEQNAPLGRAVIGGLAVATVATLFLVPVVYSLLRRQPPRVEMEDTLR